MLEQLTNLKSVLDNKGTLSKDDKAFIVQSYFDVFNRTLNIANTRCKNCYKDALIELIIKLSPRKIRMRYGCVEAYKGVYYTHKNITDEIALAIIEENPNSKNSFYGL